MSICQTQIKILMGCERLTPTQSLFKKLVPRGILFESQLKVIFLVYKLMSLIDIVSLFVEKSHRSPSDLETRIAHRPKDTVTLGFVGHKPNLTGRERLAPQSKNLLIAKRTKNWFSEIGTFSEFQRCIGRFWLACHASA